MSKLLFMVIMALVTMNANAINNKQLAFSTVKQFFHLKRLKLELDGRFVETDLNYGSACKIHVDFSNTGKEYLTVTGEYTPAGNIGDGIYFNKNISTFIQVELVNNLVTLEQKLTDSFSTATQTTVKLHKKNDTLLFSIYQQSYFLFIPQIVKKKCLVEKLLLN